MIELHAGGESRRIDRIAVRCAYRYLSQRGRRVQTDPIVEDEAPSLVADDGSGARRQLARDGVKRLYAVLDDLSPAARLAFTLHEIDGRSIAETAKLVGSSVTATKLRVWRARKSIEAAVATCRRVHDAVDEEDPTSADLLHAIIQKEEQFAWMISAASCRSRSGGTISVKARFGCPASRRSCFARATSRFRTGSFAL